MASPGPQASALLCRLFGRTGTNVSSAMVASFCLPHSLWHAIHLKVNLWHSAWMAPLPLQLRGNRKADKVEADFGWSVPPRGWCKLNVDGASQGNPRKATAGVVFRDDQRRWLGGSTTPLVTVRRLVQSFGQLSRVWRWRGGEDSSSSLLSLIPG
ncbi:unnamed protein product [Linum trigynum]|uniref:RNase H type-1 domain-containing protein n=1 Tax=Linum trigynum TaxID=586398 RepID=A0AAV2GNB7_9ROSI